MIEVKEILEIARQVNPVIKEGMNLITSGIYNSVEIVSLVVKLEESFGIRISPLDIDVDHFDTLESITNLVNMCLHEEDEEEKTTSVINVDLDMFHDNSENESIQFNTKQINITADPFPEQDASVYGEPIDTDDDFTYPEKAESVLDFLENAAHLKPQKTALEDYHGGSVSFENLLIQSKSIGTYLLEKYQCSKKPFVVLERRNIKSIVMMLGVIWSGNYYIPINEEFSATELKTLIQKTQPKSLLWQYNPRNDAIFDLDEEIDIFDEMIETEPDEELIQNRKAQIQCNDPLFGVFTSGTTGAPKCIIKNHGAMVDFITHYVTLFGFNSNDILGSKLSLMFDAVTKDIYTVLYCGAKMYLMPRGNVLPPDDAVTIQSARITAVVWTPSLLRSFVQLHILEEFSLPTLKKVLFVGESLASRYLNYWMKYKPGLLYVNLYGTSELTGNCLYKIITEPITTDIVTLDTIFPGYEVCLVDEEKNAVTTAGNSGEICVSGRMLHVGQFDELYIEPSKNDSLLEYQGKYVYHTGDIAELEEDGSYRYLGRKDYCFKHAGYRLSPGEIESVFSRLDFVYLAVCVYDVMRSEIILFWQGDEDRREELYEFAYRSLKPHMLPGKYIHVDSIRINDNGKVDREKLMKDYNEGRLE